MGDMILDGSQGNGSTGAGPMLEFAGVGRLFPDGTRALADVSFAVAPGEFVCVVGPSGSGKTTLLHLAAGLQAPTGGTIRRRGDEIGYVFQDPALLPWRTVRRNVELLAELRGLPKAEGRRRAQAAIELVGLSGFERHRPRTLSGGMRMRVSLARSRKATRTMACGGGSRKRRSGASSRYVAPYQSPITAANTNSGGVQIKRRDMRRSPVPGR